MAVIFLSETFWFGSHAHCLVAGPQNCKHDPWEAWTPVAQRACPFLRPWKLPPNSAAHFLPDSVTLTEGENPCPSSVSEGRETNRKIQSPGSAWCRKGWGAGTLPGKGHQAGFSSPSLSVPASESRGHGSHITRVNLRLGAGTTALTSSCLSCRRPGSPSWPMWPGAG